MAVSPSVLTSPVGRGSCSELVVSGLVGGVVIKAVKTGATVFSIGDSLATGSGTKNLADSVTR